MPEILVEACVESVETAEGAQRAGAGRVELCAGLREGGITPSQGMIAAARNVLEIPLFVLVRPRGGDFCYSAAEFDILKRDVEGAKETGADGVVVGILRDDGTIDIPRMEALIELARPLAVTFHRAFDFARAPHASLNALIDLGVDRLLTSGQASRAFDGLRLIAELVDQAQGRICVMPGGGITEENIATILADSGATEVHVRAAGTRDSAMRYRTSRVTLGGGDYVLPAIDSPRLQRCIAALRLRQ